MKRLAKPDIRLMGAIAAFWLCFWWLYPYKLLIDDSRYQSILQHKFLFIDTVMRPLHSWMLYLLGDAGASLTAATFVSLLIHLGTGALANWVLIPRMPEPMQIPARIGLIGFLLHPITLQTVVHVAQGSEIMGAFFLVGGLSLALKFYPDNRLTGKAAHKLRVPSAIDFRWLIVFSALALFSKENYLPPLALITAALAWSFRSRPGRNAILFLVSLLAVGALSNSFSGKVIQNQTNYERSRIFRSSVENGQEISPKDSIILPLRDRQENFFLQTSLIPFIGRVIFFPFGLVKDYGHFPYGKATYSKSLPWYWIGLGLELLAIALLFYFRNRVEPRTLALLISPVAYYAVYFVFPVYDPLFLYRLYGLVFLLFVIAIPALSQVFPVSFRAQGDRALLALSSCIAVLSVSAGFVRAYEMHDPVLEASLELSRTPENYRMHVFHLHALAESKRFPIDCSALMEPALKLAPSPALIHIEWAWCHTIQGQKEEARKHALLSLESESVPENVHVALNYMMTPNGVQFDTKKIHPTNLPVLLGNNR